MRTALGLLLMLVLQIPPAAGEVPAKAPPAPQASPPTAAKPGDADFPKPSPGGRHDKKVTAVRSGTYDLVLIGDSITHTMGELGGKYEPLKEVWKEHFASRNAINLGFNGYRTEQILWNLQNGQLDFAPSPKVAMILIGTNNSDDRHFPKVHTAEEIFAGTKAIVKLIKERHPTTRILILRIFPRGGDAEKGVSPPAFNSSKQCIETCRRAGELTAQLADGKRVFWLDVNHIFLRPDGTINTDLMWDLLHPSPAGADAWARAVVPTLDRLLKMPPAPQRLAIWPGKAPLGNGSAEAANATITVHRPAAPNGAAMVICPGGGYGGLVTGPEGHGIARWLNAHRITGIVLEYRLPRGRPSVPLLDAQRALRTVRARAREWECDPNRIGIIGFSAGGHLAATAATHFDNGTATATDPIERMSCRPDFSVLVYPVISMGPEGHGGSKRNLLGPSPTPELIEQFSNEKQVTRETAPSYLAHARDDRIVSSANSQMFHDALVAHEVPSHYLELPSGDHGLNGYKGPMWDAWQSGTLKWMASRKLIPGQTGEAQ